jgi:3-polyprenyl-4-hydroxybenzoate decarboxylase
MDTLDYTGPKVNEGSKGVLLGLGEPVRKLPESYVGGAIEGPFSKVRVFCGGCLVVEGVPHDEEPDAARMLATSPATRDWPIVILCDDADQCARSPMNFLWTVFTRFEPAADIVPRAQRVLRHQVVHTPPIVIDCRMKKPYPEELFCDEETARLVESRWLEYFPKSGRAVEMGDSDAGHLD